MRIRFEQSGGWGNPLGKIADVDTDRLDPADAAVVERLVEQAARQGSFDNRSEAARDATSYTISIEGGGQTCEIRADDVTLPDNARPLVEFLQSRATPRSLR
jgi:hypothetical protein